MGKEPKPEWFDAVVPEHEGAGGSAFVLSMDEGLASGEVQAITTLSHWLVFSPRVHAFWSWWMMSAITLREVPGAPPPYLQYPEAEYELVVAALNPEVGPPDPRAPITSGWQILTPIDVCLQFHDVPRGDDGVREMVGWFARACAHGHLAPDSDYRAMWERYLAGTLEHLRAGGHDHG